ncbi:hypothetical protein L210DRAFT_984925 [Boletus edulis BED1]|uniref:Peptidase S9 prolyl oligopeptidase catalytic domain-containing protein n=1 Tax=Boletus edulis BED1 TaxID=1328754 RepID=A0AAD4BIB3_BOLED|nr:hypothetical protein L210DRAFT_984925 [Boletus edulis BED1]
MSATSSRGWRVELDRDWDVLGPFPIHAREQHFLSPAYPLDLSLPIDTTKQYPTSLTHTASASWTHTTADPHGVIHVSHPSVPWDQIRATEGWAGLQHVNVLRGWLSVRSSGGAPKPPLLRTELLQGAFFTILPPPESPERKTHVPEWYHGNIYSLERAPVQLVRLPVSHTSNEEARYEVIICAPYEIRLFGDPSAYSSPYPVLTLNFSVSLQFPCSTTPLLEADGIQPPTEDVPLQHALTHSVIPHIVDGTPFGDAVGIGVQCLDFERRTEGCWSVVRARLAPSSTPLPPSLSVALLDEMPVRIAPTQTRIIPLRLYISSAERIPADVEQLDVELTCAPLTPLCQPSMEQLSSCTHGNAQPVTQSTLVLRATLPLIHVPLWTQEKHVPIQASYFFAKSMPTGFLVKPPKEAFADTLVPGQSDNIDKCRGNEPILALHGAGVDIFAQTFWPDSLLRQKYAWVVMPQGRSSWGLDWHGPSTADAFATVSALSRILSNSDSGRWAKWGFHTDTRVILMGHSNGGQGAWYMASRWPDRVCAVIPAAGYIKSQAYVSWCMSRFAHFIDPALRAILDSSLTPDDNDVFLGNLVGKPVLALNGGADDNVPPWQTREQLGILKTWDPNADVTYYEDPGKPHWYPEILFNKRVQDFLDRVYFSSSSPRSLGKGSGTHGVASQERKTTSFTLTVVVPAESGPLNGWQIHALMTPGLLARLRVTTTPDGQVSTQTMNISVFSFNVDVLHAACDDAKKATILEIDGDKILVDLSTGTIFFARDTSNAGLHRKPPWKIHPRTELLGTTIQNLRTPRQRLQSILSTHAPLALLVPSLAPSRELSAALRIAHALHLFHALDAQIISVSEVETTRVPQHEGNLVVIGCAETPLVQQWLERAGGTWTYVNGAWCFDSTVRFERPSSGELSTILFCQPHPCDSNGQGIALFLQSTDAAGLERAVRLFPIRTGVLSPDWLVVDGRADTIGAAGVQGAGVYGWTPPDVHNEHATGKWVWNERMSWLD